jgi:flagellar motor switch protein FliN/FliY
MTTMDIPVANEPGATEVQPVALHDLGPGAPATGSHDLRLLADVHVELSVELGRLAVPMRHLLSLAPGSVLELDRPAEGTVDVLVNGTVLARGEVVVVDGDFGVRITEIVTKGAAH